MTERNVMRRQCGRYMWEREKKWGGEKYKDEEYKWLGVLL